MKVICAREDLAYVAPRRDDIARLVWNGQWSIVGGSCITDESRFCLGFTYRRARVWRRRGERFQAENITEHDRYGGGSVMVWGGISWDGQTDRVVLNTGTLTGQRYIDDILDNHVTFYAGAVGDQFILTDDNARHHRARVVQDYLERQIMERMEWY